ncbi:MAG TPA: FHA domain-containing protein, partial [Acidimicrobiales bacterium]|nr:FHA domain-containing protein [Acidimicrobiales bacterium]
MRVVDLDGPLRIGRDGAVNDVVLAPDLDRWISRRHCRVEPDPSGVGWAVVDEGSRNGTYVRRVGSSSLEEVTVRAPLHSGDTVCLLASMAGDEPRYWEIQLHDPEMTVTAPHDRSRAACLDYDWGGGRVWVLQGGSKVEVSGLRPQEHRALRHMAARNRDGGGGAVLCSFEELVGAVWSDDPHLPHTREELARVIYEVRRRLGGAGGSEVIETVRGIGYRLLTC